MIAVIYTIIFAFLASLLAKIGIITSLVRGENLSRYSIRITRGLAAGLILGAVFIFIWPLLPVYTKDQGVWLLLGLLIFLALDRYISVFPNVYEKTVQEVKEKKRKPNVNIVFGGYVIKYFIYGVALSLGFRIGRREGIILAMGIALHQYPEAMANLASLADNWPMRRAIIAAFFSPFIIPVGSGISIFLLFSSSFRNFLAITSAILLGVLVYLGVSDLIQRINLDFLNIFAGAFGALVVFLLRVLFF